MKMLRPRDALRDKLQDQCSLGEPVLRYLSTVLAAALSFPAVAAPAASVCRLPQPKSNLVTTFSSEFSKERFLDPRRWGPLTGNGIGDPGIEAQAYAPSQVAVVPGVGLRLSTAPEPFMGKAYRSGAVSTKDLFAQTYGRFEMKARMPQANGVWPAFWLLPASGTWPPEIDVVEYIYAPNGVAPAASASAANAWVSSNPATTLHWKDANGGHQQTAPMVGDDIEQRRTYADWNTKGSPPGFHTYAIDWQPGSITWMIDGAPVFCTTDTGTTGRRVPDAPMYLILNAAVSSGTKTAPGWAGYVEPGTAWPQAMEVASVTVSRFKTLAGDPAPASVPHRASFVPMAKGSSAGVADPAAPGTSLVNGKIGQAEAKVLTRLVATDPGLCRQGTPAGFTETDSGWTWTCVGAGGGSTDPTGLAFKTR